jgi:hypothetical protein
MVMILRDIERFSLQQTRSGRHFRENDQVLNFFSERLKRKTFWAIEGTSQYLSRGSSVRHLCSENRRRKNGVDIEQENDV